MKRPGSHRARRSPRISINRHYLDEVRTRIQCPGRESALSFLTFPAEHHRVMIDGGTVTIGLPAMTVVQLYHDGVLRADRSIPVLLEIAGERRGQYLVEWLGCSDRVSRLQPLFLRLRFAGNDTAATESMT